VTRDFATDPEVAADLILRARSERDATRTAGDGDHGYGWLPEQPDEYWPCRGCGRPVGMTASAIETAKVCNRKLVAEGQKPFRKHELAVCEPCRALERKAERERDQARAQSIAALCGELRRGVLPWREAAIADELRGLGVERPEQLIKQIANETKQAAPTTGARRKSL
jgi:hypothetical protein